MVVRRIRSQAGALVLMGLLCTVAGNEPATGQLHWPPALQKEHFRVRVVGRALALPRTSFFSNHEVFVAERALSEEEGRLIKLVYEFLPYQPSLAEVGMDYSTIYDVHAIRDPRCDETLGHLMAAEDPRRDAEPSSSFQYAADAPEITVHHPKSSLPCYETTADDFGRAVRAPLRLEPPEPVPQLK